MINTTSFKRLHSTRMNYCPIVGLAVLCGCVETICSLVSVSALLLSCLVLAGRLALRVDQRALETGQSLL